MLLPVLRSNPNDIIRHSNVNQLLFCAILRISINLGCYFLNTVQKHDTKYCTISYNSLSDQVGQCIRGPTAASHYYGYSCRQNGADSTRVYFLIAETAEAYGNRFRMTDGI